MASQNAMSRVQKEEKRNARRIHLDDPVDASLSHYPVRVVDLSTSGARIQHSAPLTFTPAKRFTLEFRCEGERFELRCQVVRSRMEQAAQQTSKRLVYTSGVRFVDLSEDSIEQLWGVMALLAIGAIEHSDIAFDFEIIA